jgi:eukaryotic-like serine/threonine-protein kinase
MGVVVAARHQKLGQRVAIKFLLSQGVQAEGQLNRFLREARILSSIESDHVARVLDVGELENGSPYIVMEYLEGISLAEHLRNRGPLPIKTAVDYIIQACAGIAEAHRLGVVHRDLKPANLFLVRRGQGLEKIKVLDFGISKTSMGQEDENLTQTDTMLGSPAYMSPEQICNSRDVDSRTDIWAMGITLFELLTQRKPFAAPSLMETGLLVLNKPAPKINTLRSEVPDKLVEIIDHCLQKKRSERFPNVTVLAQALSEFGSELSQSIAKNIRLILPDDDIPPSSRASYDQVPITVGAVESTIEQDSQTIRLPPKSGAVELEEANHTNAAWRLSDRSEVVQPRKGLSKVVLAGAIGLALLSGYLIAAFVIPYRTAPAPSNGTSDSSVLGKAEPSSPLVIAAPTKPDTSVQPPAASATAQPSASAAAKPPRPIYRARPNHDRSLPTITLPTVNHP